MRAIKSQKFLALLRQIADPDFDTLSFFTDVKWKDLCAAELSFLLFRSLFHIYDNVDETFSQTTHTSTPNPSYQRDFMDVIFVIFIFTFSLVAFQMFHKTVRRKRKRETGTASI